MDWDKAKTHLYQTKEVYEEIGRAGQFGLIMVIGPLVRRYEGGERCQHLYDEIMALK